MAEPVPTVVNEAALADLSELDRVDPARVKRFVLSREQQPGVEAAAISRRVGTLDRQASDEVISR